MLYHLMSPKDCDQGHGQDALTPVVHKVSPQHGPDQRLKENTQNHQCRCYKTLEFTMLYQSELPHTVQAEINIRNQNAHAYKIQPQTVGLFKRI